MKGPFKCSYCGKKFNWPQNLRAHELTHTKLKAYSCTKCDKTFARRRELKLHFNYHLGIKPYECHLCPKKFSQGAHLKAHLRVHTGDRPFKCPICPKTFTQSSHLRTHESHHTGEKPHKCPVCGDAFRLASTLKCHSRRHTGEKPYKCHICGMSFSQTTPLYHHLQKHTGKLPWKCRYCGRGFGMKKACQDHEKLVCLAGGRRRYVCVFCKDRCYTPEELNRHILQHIGERPYLCRYCDLSFLSGEARKYHMRVHVDVDRSREKEKRFQCKLCHHSFSEEERYIRHLNQNHWQESSKGKEVTRVPVSGGEGENKEDRKFVCKHCGASFDTEAEIRDHNINTHLMRKMMRGPRRTREGVNIEGRVRVKVNEEGRVKKVSEEGRVRVKVNEKERVREVPEKRKKSNPCKMCEHSFGDDISLALHVRLVHEGVTPYKCTACWKSFPSKVNLAWHQKNTHGEARTLSRRTKDDRESSEEKKVKVELFQAPKEEAEGPGDGEDEEGFSRDVKPNNSVSVIVWEVLEHLKNEVVLLEEVAEKKFETEPVEDPEMENSSSSSPPSPRPLTSCLPFRCTSHYSRAALLNF